MVAAVKASVTLGNKLEQAIRLSVSQSPFIKILREVNGNLKDG